MPKLVDHERRRAELLAATWRVVRARGVEGTTTRAIADEAGCSLSVLAHFLGGKDDILVAAQTAVYQRIVTRAFGLGGDLSGLAALRAALDAVLPLDEERTADAHVNVAFAGRRCPAPGWPRRGVTPTARSGSCCACACGRRVRAVSCVPVSRTTT